VSLNRPQFRVVDHEDPNDVKDLAKRLEKLQTPDPFDSEYVRLELAKYVYFVNF
jgi:hypothetical protein